MDNRKFTYPFCYVPAPEIVEEAERLSSFIASDSVLSGLFAEGKMLGILEVEDCRGIVSYLYAFSGNVSGRSYVEGFVPPIFDLTDPSGLYKIKEAEINELGRRIAARDPETERLRALRKTMSEDLQKWIFENYIVHNALGESKSILDVFASKGLVPPGGTGDCAAPKLLDFAYLNGLKPVAMGEFWYGASPSSEVRTHGKFYPSCTGKCGPLLGFMLEGLDVAPNPLDSDSLWTYDEPAIVYNDDNIVVVDKPSGMLCVPGRNNRMSLQEWLAGHFGKSVYACHRLDMDTSGLVVFAFDTESQADIQRQFENRNVTKEYEARLCKGKKLLEPHGFIRLPLSSDYYDRPRQTVDYANGKTSVTEYRIIREYPNGELLVHFIPHTGRTHQLRVHSAHSEGLARPIKGDRLYGGLLTENDTTLCLRAVSLSLRHPVYGKMLHFCAPAFEIQEK